ncbi:hypothetical protein [Ferroplasma acidiphilum]|uniref:hypothetical protein n=1 Tax=Ferroplasma acidiphilum TaxID=74969 RepID=UPI0012DF96D8|nr:hypothetical protein [Ferroplasma acidiphilum]
MSKFRGDTPIENKDYVKAVFGNNNIASVLAKHIMPYRNNGMTHKRLYSLLKRALI